MGTADDDTRRTRRQRALRHRGLEDARAEEVSTPVRPPVGAGRERPARRGASCSSCRGTAAGTASRRPRSTTARTSSRSRRWAPSGCCRCRRSARCARGFAPGDLVLVDQFIDKTYRRASTFFGDGVVGHVAFAEPTCGAFAGAVAAPPAPRASRPRPPRRALPAARARASSSTAAAPTSAWRGRSSRRAPSRCCTGSWGADVIGMTAATEAKLCREAELCYASLALVTDYDAWHDEEEAVTVAAVVAVLQANVAGAKDIVRAACRVPDVALPRAAAGAPPPHAIMTAPEAISPEARGSGCACYYGRDLVSKHQSSSSLFVVGSVALDSVETRAGKRAEVLGGAASYFSVAASFLAPRRCASPAWSATTSPRSTPSCSSRTASTWRGWSASRGRTFRWAGVYAADFSTRTTLDTQLNVFQDFRPKLPPALDRLGLRVPGQHRSGAAARRARAGQEAEVRRLRHHELLDRGQAPRAPAPARARRHAAAQRRGGAPAVGRGQPAGGGARDPRAWVRRPSSSSAATPGALLFHEGGVFAAPAFPIEDVVDPTGAGDSFAGGFMGWLAREGNTSARRRSAPR